MSSFQKENHLLWCFEESAISWWSEINQEFGWIKTGREKEKEEGREEFEEEEHEDLDSEESGAKNHAGNEIWRSSQSQAKGSTKACRAQENQSDRSKCKGSYPKNKAKRWNKQIGVNCIVFVFCSFVLSTLLCLLSSAMYSTFFFELLLSFLSFISLWFTTVINRSINLMLAYSISMSHCIHHKDEWISIGYPIRKQKIIIRKFPWFFCLNIHENPVSFQV